MATAVAGANDTFLARHHFLLRRLHSLTGIIPIGVFLIEHLLTNSLAFLGAEKFNEQVHWLHELHYLIWLEVLFIFVPLAFHGAYGVIIALQARTNVQQYPYMDNWRYTIQRVTAWILVVFILVHLVHFRFAHWLGGTKYVGVDDPFALTAAGFALGLPKPVWVVLYVIGLTSAVFHFCNGIVTFCITWGITVGDQARKKLSVGAGAVGLVLLIWGVLSLVALANVEPSERPTVDAGQVAAEMTGAIRGDS